MRLTAITPILKFQESKFLGNRILVCVAPWREISTQGALVSYLAVQSGVPARTLYRWLHNYLKFGFAGLTDTPRSDRGTSKAFDGHSLAVSYVAGLVEQNKSALQIHGSLKREWARVYPDSPAPSYNATRRLIERLKQVRP